MNIPLLLRTVRHLRPTQVYHQIKYRVIRPRYVAMEAPALRQAQGPEGLKTEPIARWRCWDGVQFCFLNISAPFTTWNETSHGMLWAYNLNYVDWLNQEGISKEDCCFWIDKFIGDVCKMEDGRGKREDGKGKMCVGLDPAPIALRCENWVKVLMRWPDCATKERRDALYSQLRLLERKLEFHLLANHLLEDAYGLFIGAAYCGDERLMKKASRLLMEQLEEQILPDGAHYEQSPMYHCIMLDRLLDCINISCHTDRTDLTDCLSAFAKRMLGWMKSMCYEDGTYPLFNDAAEGIAPRPAEIIDYARRLGIESEATALGASGYRKMQNARMEAFVDVGNITATYQPGHTHADALNYELRIDGKPVVVDTGISTYDKNERRQLERSTIAHNCVSPDGRDSMEVWGGFRVGKRCRTDLTDLTDNVITASHDGFAKPCRRRFEMTNEGLVVEDWYDGEAVSYVHLAENADDKRLTVEEAKSIEVKPWKYSTAYNRFHDGKVVEIRFEGHVKYQIS